jgi:hypothetical protein
VHQPQYIPWLGYLHKIARSDLFVYLDNCQYKHREFQNRNRIMTARGELWLAVPVQVKGKRDQAIKDTMIDNAQHWGKVHFDSIRHAYAKAPYWRDHAAFFEETLCARRWDRLMDLNIAVTAYFLACFGVKTPLKIESEIGTSTESTERIIELCKKTGAHGYYSGNGAKAYMDESRFSQEGLILAYQHFVHPTYPQCNNQAAFAPYMSALDAMMNVAGDALSNLLPSEPQTAKGGI